MWTLHALHNLANALQQLHTQGISHNDVKPSNLLTFDEFLHKLADLGRATAEKSHGPWDHVKYAGDQSYAAPEFWYENSFPQQNGKIVFSVRQASDLYHLGSMAFFLMTGEKLTPMINMHMRPEHNLLNWTGTYDEVLPFVRDAFGKAMTHFDLELPADGAGSRLPEATALRAAVTQLCEPDPKKRGHPRNIANGADQYGLARYITQFDINAKTVNLRTIKV